MNTRFQLRHAAGLYWLLDMEQDAGSYKKPLAMNEMGAEIFKLMQDGKTNLQIAEILGLPEEIIETLPQPIYSSE